MSDARKCDRCKNYYDPYKTTLIFMNNMKNVDLCPNCKDTLYRWLKEYDGQEEAADDKESETEQSQGHDSP